MVAGEEGSGQMPSPSMFWARSRARLSQTPGAIRWPGRRTGQDTRALLRQLANMPEAEIDRLHREGVIYCDSRPAQPDPTSATSRAFSN